MLTTAQKATLKTFIQADTALNTLLVDGNLSGLADALNAEHTPTTKAWDRAVPVDRISDAIDDTKYTPADAPDGTALYQNRALYINIKQMNLQTKVLGRETIDATKAIVRAGLKDSVTAIPAGASGANVHPGGASGVNVMNACLRINPCTRVEKLFSAGPATTGTVTGEVLVIEGEISYTELIDMTE